MYCLQPAILSHALVKIPKSLQKSDLWSLLKDLNSELKNKQYLIEVSDVMPIFHDSGCMYCSFFFYYYVSNFILFYFRNVVIYHQQIYLFG